MCVQTHLLLHKVREDPKEGYGDGAGEHLGPFLQPFQGVPDQLSLGSEGRVNDHNELLAVDQKVLKNGVGLFSVEGVRVKEVVPDEAFRRVECLA